MCLQAKVDMDDAVETAQCERRAREMMADRLAEAMSQLEAAGLTSTAESLSGGGAANENEEEKLRREAEALRDELAAVRLHAWREGEEQMGEERMGHRRKGKGSHGREGKGDILLPNFRFSKMTFFLYCRSERPAPPSGGSCR